MSSIRAVPLLTSESEEEEEDLIFSQPNSVDSTPLLRKPPHRPPSSLELDTRPSLLGAQNERMLFESMSTAEHDEHSWLVGLNRRPNSSFTGTMRNFCRKLCGGICCMFTWCNRQRVYHERTVPLTNIADEYRRQFPANVVRNQKYSVITFVPMVLLEQFQYFLNFYFLVMACSQFIPAIRIGYLSTYWGPLAFVLGVTMIREAVDDLCRYRRDKEMNNKKYEKLVKGGSIRVRSASIRVGDLLVLHKDERIPADVVLLRTTEKQGACFIRTDQLDGETDWKMRVAVAPTQHLEKDEELFDLNAEMYIEKPQCDIHAFLGTFKRTTDDGVDQFPLNVENTMWADTVLASGTAVGFVIYTGRETRSVMNAAQPHSKFGLLDWEINNLTKVLFAFVLALSFSMIVMKGFDGPWYRYFFRFMLLFSYIIPISLRVNLDMAKVTYSWLIGRDGYLPGTVVRSSTIPEELGRISFLLSDKTGTLTKNEMIFKKLHLGSVCFASDSFDEISEHLRSAFGGDAAGARNTLVGKLAQSVEAIALCHNVTPLYEDRRDEGGFDNDATESDIHQRQHISYQAASPDEVALVTWSERVGMTLTSRDLHSITLRMPNQETRLYHILQIFPFTSETKRMGIILKEEGTGTITFFMKGADTVMRSLVQYNDWLDEECSNMAREGLRTLVVAKRTLTQQQYDTFEKEYHKAKVSVKDRSAQMAAVVAKLETDLTLLCLTGVEDALQDEVRPSLELLRNAGIKIWMLTGDKQETALCIAKSSGLFSRNENVHVFGQVLNRLEAHTELNALKRKRDVALVITGSSLKVCLQHYESELAELACNCTAVVCCRCSPEQKAQLVHLLVKYRYPRRVAAVGDGGNDVSMIQAAHAGIGIEAKEGKQASLAADFSITQFHHLCRLILVHGRYCYKRSCSLAQFVMQRGLIISVMQAIFSFMFYFASISLYQGVLMVAYSTIYTCFPVFSIVLDKDVKEQVALTFPELYKELIKGRNLTIKTFSIWLLISIYQGAVIMYGALLLFDADFIHVVSITFTALIFTELILLGLTIHTWHWLMVVAELGSILIYLVSLYFLQAYFDLTYMFSVKFMWKTAAITAVSCVPLYVAKCIRARMAPPAYAKVN